MIIFVLIVGMVLSMAAAVIAVEIKDASSWYQLRHNTDFILHTVCIVVFIVTSILLFSTIKSRYDTKIILNYNDGKYELVEKTVDGTVKDSYYKLK